MGSYEVMFIVQPRLSKEDVEKILKTFNDLIKKDGEVENTTKWGKKKLAYRIDDFEEGYYYIIDFKTTTKHLKEIERRLQLNDDIIRYLIVRR